jgi:hypothetical protein
MKHPYFVEHTYSIKALWDIYVRRFGDLMSHPFIDQMECIPLCAPRDQSHISSQIITEVSSQMLLHHDI